MQNLSVLRWGALLVFGGALLGGCKKETPPKTEAPQTMTAPLPAPSQPEQAKTGEALFKQHCAVCHPDGGNIVKPEYTLHAKSLTKHKITKPEDIVKVMRNPEQGMTRFDETAIPDKDAAEIARYILDTFK
ncbi:MAG: c-type cytochrome [Desulfobacteraceae bacterium]|nr:c-type cytochrome [Desulfobacteraceae bacterium]